MPTFPRLPVLAASAAAMLAAFTGGAVAGGTVTGAQVKDGTVTSQDIQDRSLLTRDLSRSLVASLEGAPGPQGPSGLRGARGPQGPPGLQGQPGLSGYAIVQRTVVIPEAGSDLLAADCPPGKIALSVSGWVDQSNEPVYKELRRTGGTVALDGADVPSTLHILVYCATDSV